MASIPRGWILPAIVAAILLAAAPGAIYRIIQTGDPYLFTERFFQDMVARLSGPGRLRFILQPTMAILLGTRDGLRDGRAGLPPFVWGLVFHSQHRSGLFRSAIASVRNLVAIAILLDIISQFVIFRQLHPGAAVLLGPVLIALPYATSRALSNRITRPRSARAVTPGN
ncbi:MAG TPA: hypothetical protein VEG30_04040 [Terriglobales bacterium]|nr:hypothetical protein [Terriglobales bacterium]